MHVPPVHLRRRVERDAVGDRRIFGRQDDVVPFLRHEIPKVEKDRVSTKHKLV